MTKSPCKECPWVVKNKNNDTLVEHLKRFKKKHNCHMVKEKDKGTIWEVKERYQCVGNKKYLNDSKINGVNINTPDQKI
jgi:hypothetical protein